MSDRQVGQLYIEFDADGRPYIKGLQDIDRRTRQFANDQERTFGAAGARMGGALKSALIAGATAAIAYVGTRLTQSIVKTAASYEYEMSRIKAVTKATETEMAALNKTAMQLGKDTVFSAAQSAQGITELAKAGISVKETLGGGIQGTLALASAGELDVARAAEIAANAMNVFSLGGKDVTSVADTLAAAANASSVDVTDLADALAMSGAIAANAGWSIQETVAALAELGNAGVKGSDAGTSLKQMLLSLQGPSDIAAKTMESIGLAVYDANGKMLDAQTIIGNLQTATKDLTDQERDYALEKIFGSDAVRAANILIKQGTQGYEEMTETVSQAGEAGRVSAEKMDNFQGSMEQLRGSVETLTIKAGTPMIQWLRDVVDWGTESVNWATDFYDGLQDISGWEGADLTDKIKLSFDELTRQFEEWFSGQSQLKLNPWSDLDYGTSGERKLIELGNAIGKAAGELLLGLIGDEADSNDSVWLRAGKAIVKGFWDSFDDYAAEGFKNFFQTDTLGEKEDFSGKPWWQTEANPLVWLFGERGALQQMGAQAGTWIVEGITGEPAKKEFEEGGRVSGQSFVDGFGPKVESDLPPSINSALDAPSYTAKGTTAGGEFFTGFDAELKGRFQNWNPLTGFSFANAGSAIGGGLTDAELASMLGLGLGGGDYGDTGGLQPQTSALWAMLHGIFPSTSLISGYRAYDAYPDHPSGTAIDITVPGMQKQLADAVATWAVNSGAVRYVIWNYQTWWPGGGRTTYSHNDEDPHTSHLHIRTYREGGVVDGYGTGGGREGVIIEAHPGEVVLTADQMESFGTLSDEIDALIDEIKEAVNADIEEGQREEERNSRVLDAFAERSAENQSYISRESSRYSMQQAVFATGGYSAAEIETMTGTLTDELGNINRAVAEAAAQLQAAKDLGLPQEEINSLAESLFGLQEQAADAQRELEDLASQPLADAFEEAASSTDLFRAQLALLEQTGGSIADQKGLATAIADSIAKEIEAKQAEIDLAIAQGKSATEVNRLRTELVGLQSDAADAAEAIDDLARKPLEEAAEGWNAAISQTQSIMSLLSDASFGTAAQLDLLPTLLGQMTGSLANLLDQMEAAKPEDVLGLGGQALGLIGDMYAAEKAALDRETQDLQAAVDKQEQILSERLSTMRDKHAAELAELEKFYSDKMAAFDREQQAEDRATTKAEIQAQIRSLYAKGGLAESEMSQLQSLRKQLADDEKQWARDDARKALEDQAKAAQDKLKAQQEAEEKSLETQQKALDAQKKKIDEFYQEQIDSLVTTYSTMSKTIIDTENEILGATSVWAQAMAGVADSLLSSAWGGLIGGGVSYSPAGAGEDVGSGSTDATGHRGWNTPGPSPTSYEEAIANPVDYYWSEAAGKWVAHPVSNPSGHTYEEQGTLGLDRFGPNSPYPDALDYYWRPPTRPPQIQYYDTGGWLEPGLTLAYNGTGRPEAVLAGQPQTIFEVNVHVDGPLTDSQVENLKRSVREDVISEIGRRQFAAMFSH